MKYFGLITTALSCDLVYLQKSESAFCRCSGDFCDAFEYELPNNDSFLIIESQKGGKRLEKSYPRFSRSAFGTKIQLSEDWFKIRNFQTCKNFYSRKRFDQLFIELI